jgi:DNA mismatch repair protein MutS
MFRFLVTEEKLRGSPGVAYRHSTGRRAGAREGPERRGKLETSVIRESIPQQTASLLPPADERPDESRLAESQPVEQTPDSAAKAADAAAPADRAVHQLEPASPKQASDKPAELTPFMRQWSAAKQENPDALLFFRMGDFYELFYDDAVVASRELQLTLTARDRERQVPMCGVPYHAVEGYLSRLLRKGFRIAICDQMEDPKLTKKIVRREVTRVLSPGTALDTQLGQEQNNFLAAYFEGGTKDRRDAGLITAIALLDISTGEFRTAEYRGETARQQAVDAILMAGASELLVGTSAEIPAPLERVAARTRVDDWVWTRDFAVPLVERQLKVRTLEGYGLVGHECAAIAAGALLHYVHTTQKNEALHIDSLRFEEHSTALELDPVTVRNLELVDPLFAGQDARTTLFHTLDECQTPMGKRLLRTTILRPLVVREEIEARYEAVGEAGGDLLKREELRRAFAGILDLERLLARLSLDSAGPRDVRAMGASLARLPGLKRALAEMTAGLWRALWQRLDALEDVTARIESTLVSDPPLTLADGGVVAAGLDAELDELRAISTTGRQQIAAIEERERQRTGIGSLKVRYNSVFGYYIEITKANMALAPADYERKQTLVNAERFTTPELKEYERKILTAHDRSIEIEKRIFAELRKFVLEAAGRIRRSSAAVAEADLLANFAHLAALRRYLRPTLTEELVLEAAAARHPVIECWMEETREGRFISNDLFLSSGEEGPSLLIITGPNMGGKSTYLRQAAMLVVMAQMGSFVPAGSLRLGLVDRIYTRIGASDNVARGRSTFMVEMTETATILNTATKRSLILLDEMGRGTATFDGLSLAWATVEFLHADTGARTLFATHYHELTMLAEKLKRVRNLRVGVKDGAGGIVFLHTIEPGAANKSYGIEVAKLAGLPPAVIERARHILRQHEKQERSAAAEVQADAGPEPMQLTIFTPLSQRIVDRIEAVDVNALTPLQALNLLEELQQELKDKGLSD